MGLCLVSTTNCAFITGYLITCSSMLTNLVSCYDTCTIMSIPVYVIRWKFCIIGPVLSWLPVLDIQTIFKFGCSWMNHQFQLPPVRQIISVFVS